MTVISPIYLDAAATTPCAKDVLEEMIDITKSHYGNPASTHTLGRLAKGVILENTKHISDLIGCAASELIFTSGATESNNIVILGSCNAGSKRNIVICPIDHKSVLSSADELQSRNVEVRRMRTDIFGKIDIDHLHTLLDKNTALLSISYVNSELGTYQDLDRIRLALAQTSAIFHIDAAQALGKFSINVKTLGVDCASFSAHKIEGPKGIGALYVSQRALPRLHPLTFGGGQSVLRSGTLPTPLIAGFGAAAKRLVGRNYLSCWDAAALRRDTILKILSAHKVPFLLNSPIGESTPHILNLSIQGVRSDSLINSLKTVCISSGSACNSRSLAPSYVLTGVGHDIARANSAIRLSFTSEIDLDLITAGTEILASAALMLLHLANGKY